MQVKYSSREKDKLLYLLDKERHLGDIDCFLNLLYKIQDELSHLQRRLSTCRLQFEQQICSLQREIASEQGSVHEAENAIRNTPTVETVYPDPNSLQNGEKPIQRPINQDTIARYEHEISYHQENIARANSRLSMLEQDQQHLREGEAKVTQYANTVSEAMKWLHYARENAESDCQKYQDVIHRAAICMENYVSVRGSYDSFESVSHVNPKEGW